MLDKENFSINSKNMVCIDEIKTMGTAGKIHPLSRKRASQILDQLSSVHNCLIWASLRTVPLSRSSKVGLMMRQGQTRSNTEYAVHLWQDTAESYRRIPATWEALMFSSRRKHLSNMGNKNTEKNILPSRRIWRMDDPHLLSWRICIDEHILSQKLHKEGNDGQGMWKVRRKKNCEEWVYEYPRMKGATVKTR
jgi:hypothetical protein